MKTTQRISDHMRRIIRQLGYPTAVGDHRLWVRGYIPNDIDVSGADEPDVFPVIKRLLSRPGVFVDVGANLGQTLGKVLQVDRNRAYVGFEPQIAACHMINRFIRDNALQNAIVLPIGLSTNNYIKKFYSLGDADCMASLHRTERHMDETVIQTRRGDEVLDELGISEIAAIKIDVEGTELDVLGGLQKTIFDQRPPVIFEVLPNFEGPDRTPINRVLAEQRNAQAEKLRAFWHNIGFQIYQIDRLGEEKALDRFELDNSATFIGTNFLAKHENG